MELNWRKYRRRAARHRLQTGLKELGLTSYEDYPKILENGQGENDSLRDRLSVAVTRFFREQEVWAARAQQAFPEYLRDNPDRTLIRAWTVGCCGGEEPYSLSTLGGNQRKNYDRGAIC